MIILVLAVVLVAAKAVAKRIVRMIAQVIVPDGVRDHVGITAIKFVQ